jgi:hypothetical protein
LIAAWFCANTPQAATLHLFLWMKGGEHFSHQARLARSVETLLGRPARTAAIAVAAKSAEPDRPMPALPESALAKKIELSLARPASWTFAPLARVRWPSELWPTPPSPKDEVPVPPPRTAA